MLYQWKAFINIVEGFTTAVPMTTVYNVKVSVQNGKLQVSGALMGETITVYNLQGIALYSLKADAATVAISLPGEGMYVVRVGAESVKVVNQ